jgi:hypothetical protein
MLQHHFRHESSICLSITPVNKNLKTLSVAVCFIHLLWHFQQTAISKYFKILNRFMFRFSITMNEKMVVMWYINPLTKLNIVPLPDESSICTNTTLHHFNFNLMTNKSAQHRKVLEQMKFICFKSTTFNTSRRTCYSVAHFDHEIYSQASCLCSDTKLLLCVTLSVSKLSAHLETIRLTEW